MENITTINNAANDGNEFYGIICGSDRSGGGGGGGGDGDSGGGMEDINLKKGPWTPSEDVILIDYVTKHGEGNWNAVQRNTGLARSGKSCRLRWANHLRPNLKKGSFSPEEEKLIIELHSKFGNKWARMAALLPGRTDNEIKNYWNTRVKRRQRQGLPLYSDDHDHPKTPSASTTQQSPCMTPLGSNVNNNVTSNFEFFHQNHLHSPTLNHHHSPLSSPLQHRTPSYSTHTFLDPSRSPLSSSSHSPISSSPHSNVSFTFQRPAPMLSNPIRFKRYRSSPSFNLQVSPTSTIASKSRMNPSTITQLSDLDRFRFPVQLNSSFSHFFPTPLLDSDREFSSSSSLSTFPTKLELPSNHYSQLEPDNVEFNDHSLQTSSALLGDFLLEAQALTSGQNLKKQSYMTSNDGNNFFDGCQSFDDLPLYWSSNSGLKSKEEATDLSKPVNEDLSTLHTVLPSTMQSQNWHHNNATDIANVQSSCAITDDNFGLDIKPMASLFPLSNATNHTDNSSCYSWDNLPGLC